MEKYIRSTTVIGLEKYSFVILYKNDHKALHSKFGNLNENCLLTNENVKIFIQNCPHILVVNGEIIENTMKNKIYNTKN